MKKRLSESRSNAVLAVWLSQVYLIQSVVSFFRLQHEKRNHLNMFEMIWTSIVVSDPFLMFFFFPFQFLQSFSTRNEMYSLCFKLFNICSYENCAKNTFAHIQPNHKTWLCSHPLTRTCKAMDVTVSSPPLKKHVPFTYIYMLVLFFYMCNFNWIHEHFTSKQRFPTLHSFTISTSVSRCG